MTALLWYPCVDFMAADYRVNRRCGCDRAHSEKAAVPNPGLQTLRGGVSSPEKRPPLPPSRTLGPGPGWEGSVALRSGISSPAESARLQVVETPNPTSHVPTEPTEGTE